MPYERDVAAFDERAPRYDEGRMGRLHHEICDRTAALAAVEARSRGARILDVGCGTGYLLRRLAEQSPDAAELVGIDASAAMLKVATSSPGDGRVRFVPGVVEHLPFADGAFDIVVSTTSFDHWADQAAGLVECARVLRPGGRLVLVDMFSVWMIPTLIARPGKARTKQRATRLVLAAGFQSLRWRGLYGSIIRGVVATKP